MTDPERKRWELERDVSELKEDVGEIKNDLKALRSETAKSRRDILFAVAAFAAAVAGPVIGVLFS